MNIGLFGGSFDPIHRGHLALAQAAASRYALRQVLFVPANVPPHKQKQPLTAFIHRYAMVTLATQDEKRFFQSLLEAPEFTPKHVGAGALTCPAERGSANYSIDTVRRLKKSLKKSDRLFFLVGVDAFRFARPAPHDAHRPVGATDSRPCSRTRDCAHKTRPTQGLRSARLP